MTCICASTDLINVYLPFFTQYFTCMLLHTRTDASFSTNIQETLTTQTHTHTHVCFAVFSCWQCGKRLGFTQILTWHTVNATNTALLQWVQLSYGGITACGLCCCCSLSQAAALHRKYSNLCIWECNSRRWTKLINTLDGSNDAANYLFFCFTKSIFF